MVLVGGPPNPAKDLHMWDRFTSYYFDPFFLPRSRVQAFKDLFPALRFTIVGH